MTSTIMVCPYTGCEGFSWVIEEVQRGTVHQTEDGSYFEEGMKMGPVVGSDTDENGVHCHECDELHDKDELIPKDEYEPVELSPKVAEDLYRYFRTDPALDSADDRTLRAMQALADALDEDEEWIRHGY